ncbi:hypothetical protein MBANPS3_009884 [Mucor bainieri]
MPGYYVNFTEKYKSIQIRMFLRGSRIKQIFGELDKLSFRDDRDKIKALLVELSSGENEATMSKLFNKTTRFPDDVIYYEVSDLFRLRMISILHHTLEYRSLPDDLVKRNLAAAQANEYQFNRALEQYSDMLFRFKSAFYVTATFGYNRSRFEARFALQ